MISSFYSKINFFTNYNRFPKRSLNLKSVQSCKTINKTQRTFEVKKKKKKTNIEENHKRGVSIQTMNKGHSQP